jgi:hypothetical protein
MKKSEEIWYWIMHWGNQHEQWDFLEQQCVNAHKFGVKHKSIFLQIRAGEFSCYANKGLGNIGKARHSAQIILKRYKDSDVSEKTVKKWEDFLHTLDTIDGTGEVTHE